MNDIFIWIQEFGLAGIRVAVPLLFAAYGGLLSERSGIANIALEGYLLASAFSAAAVTALTQSLWLGVVAGILGAVLVACVFAFSCIEAKADQIVAGTAINLLMAGLLPVFSRALFSVSGATPALAMELRFGQWWIFAILGLGSVVFLQFVFSKTVFGLRLSASGENPAALSTQGVDVRVTRWMAVLLGAVIASFGGIYLSMAQGSGFVRNMSAGRGFIALAALILGRWKPIPTVLACILFGYFDLLQMLLQGMKIGETPVPNQFIQILPYLATLILLAGAGGKVIPPRAINRCD